MLLNNFINFLRSFNLQLTLPIEIQQNIYKMLIKNIDLMFCLIFCNYADGDELFNSSMFFDFYYLDKGLIKRFCKCKFGSKACPQFSLFKNLEYINIKSICYVSSNERFYKLVFNNKKLGGNFFYYILKSSYKEGESSSLIYFGGEYAISSIYKFVSEDYETFNYLQEKKQDFPETNGFKFDVIFKVIDFSNHRSFYISRIESHFFCSKYRLPIDYLTYSLPIFTKQNNVIQDLYINKKNYYIFKEVLYLNSVNKENLIREITVKTDFKKLEELNLKREDIIDLFKFDLDVDVKNFEEKYEDKATFVINRQNYFYSLDIYFLIFESKIDRIISDVFGNFLPYERTGNDIRKVNNRKFYPQGEFGDFLYKYFVLHTKNVRKILQYRILEVESPESFVHITLLDSDSIEEVIDKNYNKDLYENLEINNTTIKINNEEIITKQLSFKLPINGQDKQINHFLVLFKNKVYLIEYYEVLKDENGYEIDFISKDISNYSFYAFGRGTKEFDMFREAIELW